MGHFSLNCQRRAIRVCYPVIVFQTPSGRTHPGQQVAPVLLISRADRSFL